MTSTGSVLWLIGNACQGAGRRSRRTLLLYLVFTTPLPSTVRFFKKPPPDCTKRNAFVDSLARNPRCAFAHRSCSLTPACPLDVYTHHTWISVAPLVCSQGGLAFHRTVWENGHVANTLHCFSEGGNMRCPDVC